MPPTPRLYKPNATFISKILTNFKNESKTWKKLYISL